MFLSASARETGHLQMEESNALARTSPKVYFVFNTSSGPLGFAIHPAIQSVIQPNYRSLINKGNNSYPVHSGGSPVRQVFHLKINRLQAIVSESHL